MSGCALAKSAYRVIVKVADFVVPLSLPDIVTLFVDDTVVVAIVNAALVVPLRTVTLAGSDADELLSDKVTTKPPEGAAPVNVTVPVEEVPPFTLVGLTDIEEIAGGLTVKVAVFVVPLRVPDIVASVELATGDVVIGKVAVVAPASTVTLEGKLAAALLLESATDIPPAGAALASVTVPVEEIPPVTVAGFKLTDETVSAATGRTVSVAPRVPL